MIDRIKQQAISRWFNLYPTYWRINAPLTEEKFRMFMENVIIDPEKKEAYLKGLIDGQIIGSPRFQLLDFNEKIFLIGQQIKLLGVELRKIHKQQHTKNGEGASE